MTDFKYCFTELTSADVASHVSEESVVCLPIGSAEQHGPHLPLNTDTIIATRVAARIVSEFHSTYDLWLLPALDYGLSPEHLWAPGTISLSAELFAALFHELVKGLMTTQAARNLLIINGHGGNRGLLETLIQECRFRYSLAACVIHPSALSDVKSGSTFPEVHGGKSETSVMLALAPELVNRDRLPPPMKTGDAPDVRFRVLERGVSWPWNSNDPGISSDGVIGDAALACPALGTGIIDSCIRNAEEVVRSLIEYGRVIRHGSRGCGNDRDRQ